MEKILYIHNYYQQRGGEDESYDAEVRLLENRGHEVISYTLHNDTIEQLNRREVVRQTIWNRRVYDDILSIVQQQKPSIAHLNNTFPLISPAANYAAHKAGIPVVQNLRNYRMFCLNGLFFRSGTVCEDCFGKRFPWPGVRHGCYRNDRLASGTVATYLTLHRLWKSWQKHVDVFVALSEFARNKFVEGGFPPGRMRVKPNFLEHPPEPGHGEGGYALFVGRLSHEKGTETLIDAWKKLGGDLTLKIVGDGPMGEKGRASTERMTNVEWLGGRSILEVYQLMGDALMVIFPSEWYETFGRVGMESFAAGTPVIAADIGAVAELVEHGKTGLLFRPGNSSDLAAKVEWAFANPGEWLEMRINARLVYDQRYTPDRNYERLMSIYAQAAEEFAGNGRFVRNHVFRPAEKSFNA